MHTSSAKSKHTMIKGNPNLSAKIQIPSDAVQQFHLGLKYWHQGNFLQAERWLHYACTQGYKPATRQLKLGMKLEYFQGTSSCLRAAAIGLLEAIITPEPTEEQLKALEFILLKYLSRTYGLR